jgi:hypothetical protein
MGLIGEDSCPLASAAVDPDVVDVSADAWLEHGFRDGDREQIVLTRFDGVEIIGEHGECTLDGGVNHDVVPNRFNVRWVHDSSPSSSSTIRLYTPRALTQNRSRSARNASMPLGSRW